MIVAVIAARDVAEVRRAIAGAADRLAGAPAMVEVRLDSLDVPDPAAVAEAPLPVIATCRRARDGGAWSGSEDARQHLLRASLAAGARYVDIEADVFAEGHWSAGPAALVSHHDAAQAPGDAHREIVREALRRGAAMVKIVTAARSLEDILALRRLAALAPGRVIAFGAGKVALAARLRFRSLGSPWVYARATSDEGNSLGAPRSSAASSANTAADGSARARVAAALIDAGVPSLDDAVGLYWSGAALPEPEAVLGVVSDRPELSIGPLVYNQLFREAGVAAQYVPVPARGLASLRDACEVLGIRGLSVTTPFKVQALEAADEVDPLAARIGSANTLVARGGRWAAYNTDYAGVQEPIRAALEGAAPGGPAVVVGAGGAGRAAAAALADLGCEVAVVARREQDLGALGGSVTLRTGWNGPPPAILVHATPVGGPRDPSGLCVPAAWLAKSQIVLEMIYGLGETRLETMARLAGARVIRGSEMYEVQARAQLAHFLPGRGLERVALRERIAWALRVQASS